MALTLAEALRARQQVTPTLAGVVQTFLDASPVLNYLRFRNVPGGTVSLTRWKTLPTVGFRALNAQYADSAGATETISEDLKLLGGRVVIDRALINRAGAEAAALQARMQVEAIARKFNYTFFKGDGTGDSFTGLQSRITGNQLYDMANAALDLNVLNEAILESKGTDKIIFMGRKMLAKFWKKYNSVSNIAFDPGQFGVRPPSYNGIPIILAGEDATEADVLDFNEGVNNNTSIYIVSFSETSGVIGAQTQDIQTYNINTESYAGDYEIEWDVNFIVQSARSAIRIQGIADSDIA